MSTKPKYYIVEASALPDVFLKVAEAKRLLSTGEASTVNEATRMTDISRSAFYKYRDAVLPFQNMMTGRIITFQLLLHDEPGLLSEILGVFAEDGANIITINSIVPTNGTAVVTISAETMDLKVPLEEMLSKLSTTHGVLKAEVLAG
ncbi:MAG: ACT domain-containing protein [Faecousia sp.]